MNWLLESLISFPLPLAPVADPELSLRNGSSCFGGVECLPSVGINMKNELSKKATTLPFFRCVVWRVLMKEPNSKFVLQTLV
jgi:hypothetical protein